jgi:glutamyl-tRNA reductase
MFIIAVGVNHRTAPVEVRERLSFTEHSLKDSLNKLRSCPAVEGCVILFTCNRTEIYAATRELDEGLNAVRDYLSKRSGMDISQIKNYTYVHTLHDAIRHLFRVAAGLDSMLLGETQILGQVRTAYQLACAGGSTNRVLNTLFQQAIMVGKRVRRETGIDQNAVSISYAAVDLARKTLGDLNGRSVLIIGAGKMSELAARYLVANGVSGIIVSNRSYQRAVDLAKEFSGRAVKFDELYNHLPDSDIVISCTAASHYVVHYRQVAEMMGGLPGKKIMMIDIAVPRDIDPLVAGLPGIALYDIDDLQGVVDQNLAWRSQVAVEAERIIEEELDRFMQWLGTQFVVPTVSALKQWAEQIKQNELRRALNRLGELSEHDRKVVGSLANSIVNQLLHVPVTRLKDYALTSKGHLYTEVLQNLFDLEVEDEQAGSTVKSIET